MNIVEHELKKYDMWNEELQKKKKADILLLRKLKSSFILGTLIKRSLAILVHLRARQVMHTKYLANFSLYC